MLQFYLFLMKNYMIIKAKRERKDTIVNGLFFLFVTLTIVDAGNIFTGLKTPLFLFLMVFLFLKYKNVDVKIIRKVLILVGISVISLAFGTLYGYDHDKPTMMQFLFTYSILLLLCWRKHFKITETLINVPALILSIGTIVAWLSMQMFPSLYSFIYAFSDSIQPPVIFLDDRQFLGVTFYSVFYTPLVFCVLPASVSFYKFLFEKSSKGKNLVFSGIFCFGLFCGGNRACLLCVIIVVGGMAMFYLWKKSKALATIVSLICISLFLILALNLSGEDEDSNNIKRDHLKTYVKILKEEPYVYITGMGPGAMVYTRGFGAKAPLMEWQYIELFRYYGIGALFVLALYISPMWYLWRHKKRYRYAIPLMWGCLSYMASSMGNPYLLNSTGMLVVIILESYIKNNKNDNIVFYSNSYIQRRKRFS